MEWLNAIVDCAIAKINGTAVERAINEEVAIMKAECKLAELSVDTQKAVSKINDETVKTTYNGAVARIRAKQQS